MGDSLNRESEEPRREPQIAQMTQTGKLPNEPIAFGAVQCFEFKVQSFRKLRNEANWSRKGQDEQDRQDGGSEIYQTKPPSVDRKFEIPDLRGGLRSTVIDRRYSKTKPIFVVFVVQRKITKRTQRVRENHAVWARRFNVPGLRFEAQSDANFAKRTRSDLGYLRLVAGNHP